MLEIKGQSKSVHTNLWMLNRSEVPNAPRFGFGSGDASFLQLALLCDFSYYYPIQQLHTAKMAEQIPNGDVPVNTDVEMKEESALEVQYTHYRPGYSR